MAYEPKKEDHLTTGLWCTAFNGREVFGVPVRPPLDPIDNASALESQTFDLRAMAERRLAYQRLEQLVFEPLTGAR
jgi:hypothetical protein